MSGFEIGLPEASRDGHVEGGSGVPGVAESATARIRAVFADAGCAGWLHARRCDGSPARSLSVGATAW